MGFEQHRRGQPMATVMVPASQWSGACFGSGLRAQPLQRSRGSAIHRGCFRAGFRGELLGGAGHACL